VLKIEHDAQGQGDGRRLCRQGRRAASPEGAHRRGRRQLDRKARGCSSNSASSKFPDGLANASGQVGKKLHAPHDGLGLRHLRQAGAHVPRHDDGRHRARRNRSTIPKRGFVGGYEMETLSLGLPFMAALSRARRPGAATTARRSTSTPTWPGCGWSARTCRAPSNRITLHASEKDQYGPARAERQFRRSRERSRDARARLQAGRGASIARSAPSVSSRRRPTPSTHNLGTNRMSAKAGDGVVNKHGPDARHQEPLHRRRQPVHVGRRREPDPDDRRAGDPPGRLHQRRDGAKKRSERARRARAAPGRPADGRDLTARLPGTRPPETRIQDRGYRHQHAGALALPLRHETDVRRQSGRLEKTTPPRRRPPDQLPAFTKLSPIDT